MESRGDLSACVVPTKYIQEVRNLIDTRQLVRALRRIDRLQVNYPSSAYLLALKALVYKMTALRGDALSFCEKAMDNLSADESVLPEVLSILQIVYHFFGMGDLVTGCNKTACDLFPYNLDLMKGLFYCYHRQLSFKIQLKISLEMYMKSRSPMFLFWFVFILQLQACRRLLKERINHTKDDEPETFLVYFSVKEQLTMTMKDVGFDVGCEILSKLGPTLLVAEVVGKHLKGVRLLDRISDYIAAAAVLHQHLEDCHHVRVYPIEGPGTFVYDCKLFQLSKDKCGSEILEVLKDVDLLSARNICLTVREKVVDEAVKEYFIRHGSNAKVCLQVLTKDEGLQLIDNLLNIEKLTPDALQKQFNSICNERTGGVIKPWRQSGGHGTSIALKTKNFIILAADGKLTPRYCYHALGLKANKLMNFDDMGVVLTGDWQNLSRTLSTLSRCINFLKGKGQGRPTVDKFADFARKKLFSRVSGTQMIFGAFDQLKKDGEPVASVFYADQHLRYDINRPFFCAGTGFEYASYILSKGNVRDDMLLEEAISLVERALAYANMCDDGRTGGWASIHVIHKNQGIIEMPREQISSTLWRRHFSAFENV